MHDIGFKLAEFMQFYNYTLESALKVSIRQFLLLCRHMRQLKAQDSLMRYKLANMQLVEDKQRKDFINDLYKQAYPDEAEKIDREKRWWEEPVKGIKQIE